MFFESVKFYLPETFDPQRRSQITHGIERNGGESADTIHSATHVITNSNRFQGWQDVDESVEIISDIWVDRSLILGQLLPCQFYSPDPEKTFSGVVACASGVSPTDLICMEAGVKALGGQWRHGLTKDVTHLFATSPDSDKYAAAMRYQEDTKMKVLLPHWFNDAVRLGNGKLLTAPYEWPDPKILHPAPSEVEGKKEKTESSSRKLSDAKRAFYKTAIWNPDKGGQFPGPAEPCDDGVWGGRKVLLSPSLGLEGARRRVLEEAVEAAGGLIVTYTSYNGDGDEDEAYDLASVCDVFVTRWRAGQAFFKAFAESKIIGTLNWLFYVHATGVLSSPMDQLLHFPTRKLPIEDFTTQQITVTNYTGEARDYIKRLIHTMGAVFTPNMTGSNTVLIAAHMGGIKTAKALSWSIPIVNHTWLEDCFVQWRSLTPAVTKYIEFPPNLDFAPMLAERGVTATLDELGTEEEEDVIARAQVPERPPVGTEASVREVEGLLDDGEDIVMDDEDALETGEYLAPVRKPKSGSSRRVVSASISPTKNRSTEEDLFTDPQKSSKRSKKQAPGDAVEPQPETTAIKASAKRRTRKEREKHPIPVEESETESVRPTKATGKGKEKQTKPTKVMFVPETETDSAGPSNPRAPRKPPARATSSTSTKRKAPLMDSASTDDVANARQSDPPPPRKRAKPDKGVESDASSPPAPANGTASSSAKRKATAGASRDSPPRKMARTESLRVLADERPSSSKSATKKQSATSAAAAQTKPRRAAAAGAKKTTPNETRDDGDDLMPDVINYELEGRTQRSLGKRREEMESADEMPPPKASKPKAGKKDTTANASSGSRTPRKSATAVRIMTTTVTLPDSVLKALSKLGVKATTQISECTHLIAPSLVRTEKFLCALAAGAFILSDKWAIDSAAANKLLPEKDYILDDKINEEKWHFRLVDAMARAKEVGGKLFENMTFYVTPKVPVEINLLKNVVTAQGGKVSKQTPTIRVLNSNSGPSSSLSRYVISCPEDISIWRPLTKDHTIYSQELLLTGAVTQRIDWDNPAFRVSDSA
ncbi:hypothetical protein B0H17DRAFT_1041781 [Mycena rosella]|uniref:BRCT domain-containing protein n=1 Tax=Mycena rosella TaxID=1033263 RepID=A0AAD7DZ46_MYCRO|nr:hypothetical protein B0H17DRAFT_1041781 [Mycena rosella]